LSADEIPRRMQQNFKSADANKDGSITQKEFDEAMRRRKEGGK
jgi:Ca2+-binding EF-hand superfamily protein